MLGLFGTLNLASGALQAQMAGVEVAGQNLANVNTPGYSRQQVILQAGPDLVTTLGGVGTGVTVQSIQRLVNTMLEGQIQNQGSVSGYWNTQQAVLQNVQSALNEYLSSGSTSGPLTTTGLSVQISGFFKALQTLANSPSSSTAAAAISAAKSLATNFQQTNSNLANVSSALDSSLSSQVGSANQLLSDIAALNTQIAAGQASGGAANDLLDLRQQKLEALSQYLNFQSSTQTDGSVTVTALNSQTLVSGNQVTNQLTTAADPTTGTLQVWTTASNTQLTGVSTGLTSGSLEATVDVRDGALATLQNSINSLASNLITQVNALYSAGYSLPDPITGAVYTGANFFTGTDASNISVDSSLAANPKLFQAAGVSGSSDGAVALSIADLATTAQAALGNQTFSGAYAQSVSQLGTALNNANDQVTTQTQVSNMLATQRSSVSGVNLDEEMTNLMTYQRAYQAAAHVVSTVDQMIQTVLAMKN